ncbi:hypothetical protein [Riemerella anatipestifer]|uniref:Uncharacterized protein n=1 Tax=Riemerella anatipestifer TaxID=34085 RepID=A0AAP6HCT9_RIEAN|nr:hypothetical protein [Riemerella anatipestifer]MCO7354037.1 hypothetical protein [Riemerella anatipestifer]MCU7571137.1 hypothetical protein [Riemerella anatipestifer]MCU7597586.1 hypothetical protein [Riemerella anatipestifer]MCW0488329.1 hypothetical protein [Riemerella anatipestifer]MCW0494209.1 hypothetical protein [Riemerella anatipestifer]
MENKPTQTSKLPIKDKLLRIKEHIYKNPKMFYKYSMVTLIIFFAFSIWREIYYPPRYLDILEIPTIQRKSDQDIKILKKQEKTKENESKIILQELEELGKKRQNKSLNESDSLRAEFLMKKYNTINNGGF